MQTLVINTQYRENYAAHDEGYRHGVDEAYWKFKGGSTYFVTDLTEANVNSIVANGIPTLTKLIESKNEAFEEYIIDWEIRDLGKNGDGKGPICESWEIATEFYYEDKQWKCRTHHTPGDESHWNSAIKSRAEQWIPGEGGTRNDYQCQYKTKNGWFDQKDPQLKTEVEAA
jgi:hypothetical protein